MNESWKWRNDKEKIAENNVKSDFDVHIYGI